MLGENQLPDINIADGIIPNLKAISLVKVNINSWSSLNSLNQFPNLIDLRLQEVPLLNSLSTKSSRYLIIGRIQKLTKLNGSDVKESERKDAEKYYLQQCYSEFVELQNSNEKHDQFLEENPRYNELLNLFGTPSLSGSSDDPETLAGGLISLYLTNTNVELFAKFSFFRNSFRIRGK